MRLTPEQFSDVYEVSLGKTQKAMENLRNRNAVLFAMSGKMGAGKDTIGDLLVSRIKNKHEVQTFSFSYPIKKEIQEIMDFIKNSPSDIMGVKKGNENTIDLIPAAKQYNVNVSEVNLLYEYLKNDSIYNRSTNSRNAIQFWGTDIRRKQDMNYWVKQLADTIVDKLSKGISIYISDARFENEVNLVANLGGQIIRLECSENIRVNRIVERDNLKPTKEHLEHFSETALDDYEFDKVFDASKSIENIFTEAYDYIKGNNRGLFITFEGPDGSGKSTIAKRLYKYLVDKGYKCVLTREPGGTNIGENLRNVLLSNENTHLSDRTEALVFAAARAQHVDGKIRPLLEQGYIVISDRYFYSSLAYQGYARGLGIEEVLEINEFAMNGMYPDRTLFFDVEPEVALSRKFIGREADRLENEGNDFHNKTYKGYQKILNKYESEVDIINANLDEEKTYKQCKKVVEDLIGKLEKK